MKSRMHPGWATFLLALGAGVFIMTTLAVGARIAVTGGPAPWGYISFTAGIGMLLLVLGARKAETLTDCAFYFEVMNDQDKFRDMIAREIWAYQQLGEQFTLGFDDPDGLSIARDMAKRMCIDEAERIRYAIMHSPIRRMP